jgi:hypothetical protein
MARRALHVQARPQRRYQSLPPNRSRLQRSRSAGTTSRGAEQ